MHIDAALLRACLSDPLPLPSLGSAIDLARAKAAAVVVPIALQPEPHAVLVLRASHLADHASEVGFPGGKRDPDDPTIESTALRELAEELAVRAEDVDIVGTLTPVPVITGRYLIHPFVGVLSEAAAPAIASPEIERVISLPILPLIRGDHPISAVRGEWNGLPVFAPHIELDGAILYGATAYIFYELLLRIAARLGRTLPEPTITTELPWGNRYDR